MQNLEGDATTPSVVFFDQSSVVIGKEALKISENEPDRVAQFAKRHLGKQAFSIDVAGRRFPPEVIQALILKKLKEDATQRLGKIDKCVVTVPAYFNEPGRHRHHLPLYGEPNEDEIMDDSEKTLDLTKMKDEPAAAPKSP